jgi:RNA polymerase sigma factor (sigma-70 family)
MTIPEQSYPINHPEATAISADIVAKAERYQELAGVATRHAMSILRNPHLAQDAALEAMCAAWKVGALDNAEFPTAYIATAARNTAITIALSDNMRKTALYEDPEIARPRPLEAANPESTIEIRNTVAQVGRAIGVLEQEFSETGAKIIRLTAQEMTPKQIGEMLGMTPNTVSAQLYRFRIKLRKYLEENES